MDHFAHPCFREGKLRKPKKVKETDDIEAEDQSGTTESSNQLSETIFCLQTTAAVVEGGVEERHIAGKLLYLRLMLRRLLGVEEKQLYPTTTIIRVANKIKLNVLVMLPVNVQVAGHP